MQAGSDPDVKKLFEPTLKMMDMGDGYFIAPSAKTPGCFDICSLAEYFGDLARETATTMKARNRTPPVEGGGRAGLAGLRVHAGTCGCMHCFLACDLWVRVWVWVHVGAGCMWVSAGACMAVGAGAGAGRF